MREAGDSARTFINKQLECDAGIHDVLDDEHFAAAQTLTERVGHIDGVLALFDIAIDMDEFNGGRDVQFTDEVCEKADDAVQRTDTDNLAAGVVDAELRGEFLDAAAESSGADEDAINTLGGGGGEGRRAP